MININNDESIPILVNLGLTALEAKIYLTLLESDANTAQEISTISEVPRPDVYRVLVQLEEKKIVERIIDRPTKHRALPIETCASILMEQRTKELVETQKKIPILIQHLSESTKKLQKTPKSDFVLIPKEALTPRIEKMIRSAKESIFIVAPAEKPIFPISKLQSAKEEALSRNVDCRILVLETKNEKIKSMVSKRTHLFSNFQVRFVKNMPKTAMGTFDGKEVIIGTQLVENPSFSAIWSNNKCLLDLCEDYFYSQWRKNTRPD